MANNGDVTGWIPDGYTRSFFIRGVPGLYPDTRGSLRPLVVIKQAEINREMRQAGEDLKKQQWIAAKWIAQQVVDWDIKKSADGDLVSTEDVSEILKLQPELFQRIWGIVNGVDGGDVDENATAYEMRIAAKREVAIAATGMDPTELDEGN